MLGVLLSRGAWLERASQSVINFYTFGTTAIIYSSPNEETMVGLGQHFQRIKTQHYDTDYDFNIDLYFTVNRLYDGRHTMWIHDCYVNALVQDLLPIAIVSLAKHIDSYGEINTPSEVIYVTPGANGFFSPIPQWLLSQVL